MGVSELCFYGWGSCLCGCESCLSPTRFVSKRAFSRASGLVAKSNVAIVGPRVRFPAGAGSESRMM